MSGVSGVFSNNRQIIEEEQVSRLLYENAIIQDKRGQAGAGIILANPKRLKVLKDRGPARESVRLERLRHMSDHTTFAGLSFNAYSKNRFLRTEDIHPLQINSKKYEIYIVSDGVILDKGEKRRELEEEGYSFKSSTSAAVIGTSFARYIDETGDVFESGERVIEDSQGSGVFSSILLVRNKKDGKTRLVIIKDKKANKPLYIGEGDNTLFANSETFPLERNGLEDIRRVKGGDVIVFSDNGIDYNENSGDYSIEMPCIFEIIYFGNPDNRVMEKLGPNFGGYLDYLGRKMPERGPSNFTVRQCLGLAWHDHWKDSVPEPQLISPVVTSGNGFTHGIACGYKIDPRKYMDAIGINHALKTYQISDPDVRRIEGNLKMRYLTDALQGKRLLIGDDSIVRGGVGGIHTGEGTNRFFSDKYQLLISQLKEIGKVSDIFMAISYAPMFFQCFYSFGNMEENAAQGFAGMGLEEICDSVSRKMDPDWGSSGRFKVRYNPLEMILDVCGRGYCTACADGNYPVDEKFVPQEIVERRERYRGTA